MNPLLNLLSSTLLSHWKVHQLSTQIINIHRLHDNDQVMFCAHLVICRVCLMRWRLLCSTKKWKLIFAWHKMYSHKFLLFRMSLILGFICPNSPGSQCELSSFSLFWLCFDTFGRSIRYDSRPFHNSSGTKQLARIEQTLRHVYAFSFL